MLRFNVWRIDVAQIIFVNAVIRLRGLDWRVVDEWHDRLVLLGVEGRCQVNGLAWKDIRIRNNQHKQETDNKLKVLLCARVICFNKILLQDNCSPNLNNNYVQNVSERAWIRKISEELLWHVWNDVGEEFRSGEKHFLEIRFHLTLRLRGQQVEVDLKIFNKINKNNNLMELNST